MGKNAAGKIFETGESHVVQDSLLQDHAITLAVLSNESDAVTDRFPRR